MPKNVVDVMTTEPIVASPEMPLKQAIQILAEHRISCLPVVDQSGQLVGMISDTDILWQESGITPPPYITILDSIIFLERPARLDQELHKALGSTVAEVMTKSVVTVAPDRPLSEAARLMNEKRVYHFPVIDQQKAVVGVLSCSDIIQAMAKADGSPV
ncbi:MAG: CBS domain-containing protein [Microcoleaceae cyanobacterium]